MLELATAAVFLAFVNKLLVDTIMAPIQKKWPNLDYWWVFYLALVTGGVMGWFSGLNLFQTYFATETVGRILTCVAIGCGSSVINEIATTLRINPVLPEPEKVKQEELAQ